MAENCDPHCDPHGEMSGRKQWNKQAATSSFLNKKTPQSLIQHGLEGSTAVGKDEVGSSNLPSSSIEKPWNHYGFEVFSFFRATPQILRFAGSAKHYAKRKSVCNARLFHAETFNSCMSFAERSGLS